MRTKLLFLILSIAIIFMFAGCGSVSGSSQQAASPTPTPIASPLPSPTPTPVASKPSAFIFGIVAFESDTGYVGGQINSATGAVTPGSPFNDAGLGQNIVVQLISDPQGR